MKMRQLFFRNNFFDKNNAHLELGDLMRKACLVHQDASGVFSMLTLGLRLQQKIQCVIQSEMEALGFGEMQLSTLQDSALWHQTQRIESYGAELFRLKDRRGHEWCLGATAEELVTHIVKNHYQGSDINLHVYAMGNKYRDEIRARAGLIRSKQFVMKDAYSFVCSQEQLTQTYEAVRGAYGRILEHFGLDYEIVASDNGEIGGTCSHEFVVQSQFGEDTKDTGQDERKLLEVAHVFQLGQHYSEKMGLVDNLKNHVFMGCYGMGVSRLLMCLCERHRDDAGFWGSEQLCTFDTVICALDYHRNEAVRNLADQVYARYKALGVDVLLDDRADNAGKKMSDSEMLFARARLVISSQSLAKNQFEWMERRGMKKTFLTQQQLVDSTHR